MPVMDGLEATEKLRTDLKVTVPIIVLSAEFSDSIKEKAKSVGATTFVEKPVNMLYFIDLIYSLV